MTEFSGPFDVDPPDTPGGYEGMFQAEWTRMARVWAEDAVVGDQGGPALQVYISGAQVGVRVGEAEIRGHWYRNTAPILWTPEPNAAGQPRVDRVVLRLDRSAKDIHVAVLAGTPGSGRPGLTQSDADDGVYEISLGGYTIPAGGTLPEGQFDERMFQGLRLWRPGVEDVLPTVGVPLWQPAVLPDGRTARWDGTDWRKEASGGWVMNVATAAYSWPATAQYGSWTRDARGIAQGTAVCALNVNPPPGGATGPLTISLPVSVAGGTYLGGTVTVTNAAGAVIAHGYLLGAGGTTAVGRSFTGDLSVAPLNGYTVTANFRFA